MTGVLCNGIVLSLGINDWTKRMTEKDFFGGRIKAVRDEKRWTQMNLAMRTGLNPATISNLENGKQMPRSKTIEKIIYALGISPDDFYGDTHDLHVRASPPTMADLESLLFKLGLTEYDVQDITHMVEDKLERQGKNSGKAAS